MTYGPQHHEPGSVPSRAPEPGRRDILATHWGELDEDTPPNAVEVDEHGCSCTLQPWPDTPPRDPACPKHGDPLRPGDGAVLVTRPDGSTYVIPDPPGDPAGYWERLHEAALDPDDYGPLHRLEALLKDLPDQALLSAGRIRAALDGTTS